MRTKVIATVVTALVLAAPAASAHVTVQPTEAAAGSFARFVVRVPNERDNAATVKVEVQLPEGLEARFQPKAGWTRTVSGRTVTWEGGRIEPGEFDEFGFSTRMPDKPTLLEFPAVQTYSNGEVVRWVGPADAEEPAARVTVSGKVSGGDDHHRETTASEKTADDDGEDDDDDDHTSHLGTVLGAIGIVLGGVALAVALRRRA